MQISLGRSGGIRPADLVGAIANEAGLTGRDIGPIRINEHSSIVGVPVSSVESVIAAMSSAVVRGKAVDVRRFVEDSRRGDGDDRPRGGPRGGQGYPRVDCPERRGPRPSAKVKRGNKPS